MVDIMNSTKETVHILGYAKEINEILFEYVQVITVTFLVI